MKVTTDPSVRALYIQLRSAPINDSEEVAPGVVLDFDSAGAIIGIEMLDATTSGTTEQVLQANLPRLPECVREQVTAWLPGNS
jgi:uncharacterized protein YuzE